MSDRPKLIAIENGTKRFMPLDHALRAVNEQRAVIIGGKVRFNKPAGDSDEYDHDTGDASFSWKGRPSGGFQVMQAQKILPRN